MYHHRFEPLVIRQCRVVEPGLRIGRRLFADRLVHRNPHARDGLLQRGSRGGVFKYSTTCGSMPALLIVASALRDVPQSGLW